MHGSPRVAVVGPFTGSRAAWGELLTDAIGELPHPPVRWELFDDRGDAGEAAARAGEVVADGGFAAVIGHFNSQGAGAAMPLYRAAGLPLLLPLATAAGLVSPADDLVLRLCPDDDAQAAAIVRYCRECGYARLDVVHDGTGYGTGLAERLMATGYPVRMHPAWPDEPAVVVLCGVHHWAAEQVRAHARDGTTVLAVDDCDVAEFAHLAGPTPGELLVARLAGGPYGRVVTAFAGLAGALAKHPRLRGSPLLAAARGEVAEPQTGWQVSPVPPRPRTDGFDVAVVGGGVVGRAAAAELAEAGARVALFDPGGGGVAASIVSGALVRAFEPDERNRRLAVRAYQVLWGRPELAALHGFRRTGSLVLLGPEHLDEAAAGVAQLRDGGVDASLLSISDIAGRWPGLRVDGLAGAVWEPGGGYAVPAVTLAVLADRARQAGVAVLRRAVRTLATAEPLADRVLIAAGCATPAILGAAWPGDRPARTRRIRYAILDAGGERLPIIVDLTTGLWGRPDGADGFLAGMPVDEWDVPVVADTGLADDQMAGLRAGLTARLPRLASADVLTARFGTDLYVAGGPVLGSLPGAPGTWVAAGWSGGGFKTAPGVARRLAETEWGVRDVQR